MKTIKVDNVKTQVILEVEIGDTTAKVSHFTNPNSWVYISIQKIYWEDCYTYDTRIEPDVPIDALEKWLTNELRYIDEKLGSDMPHQTHQYYQSYFSKKTIQDIIPNAVRFIKED